MRYFVAGRWWSVLCRNRTRSRHRFIDTQSQRLGFPDGTFRTVPKFYAGGGGVGPLGPNGAVEQANSRGGGSEGVGCCQGSS